MITARNSDKRVSGLRSPGLLREQPTLMRMRKKGRKVRRKDRRKEEKKKEKSTFYLKVPTKSS